MYWFLFPEEWITLLCAYLDCYTLAPFRATYSIAHDKAQTVHVLYFNTHRDALESANRLLSRELEQLGTETFPRGYVHGGIYHQWRTLVHQNVSLEQIYHTTGYIVSNRRLEQQSAYHTVVIEEERALALELQYGSDDEWSDNPWSGLR